MYKMHLEGRGILRIISSSLSMDCNILLFAVFFFTFNVQIIWHVFYEFAGVSWSDNDEEKALTTWI